MVSSRWMDRRRAHWNRLEELVERSRRKGLSALEHRELQELGLLYRQVAADLAVVRETPEMRRLAAYLNHLLGGAHNIVYRSRRVRGGGIAGFYRKTFPRVFRETLPLTLMAAGLFVSGAVAGALIGHHDPAFLHLMVNEEMVDTIERRELWTHSILSMKPVASSAIMTNNISVSFLVVASGISGGLGTIYLMLLNGLSIGVIGAACWSSGMSLKLWSFVAPHGVLELPAIFIAGGAGLEIGRGLLFPGTLPRRDSLKRSGRTAARLVLGLVPIMVVAGIIEGFVSPSPLPVPAKFTLAMAVGGLLLFYLARTGLRRERSP